MRNWCRNHGLLLVLAMVAVSSAAMVPTRFRSPDADQPDHAQAAVTLLQYLGPAVLVRVVPELAVRVDLRGLDGRGLGHLRQRGSEESEPVAAPDPSSAP